MFKNIQKHLLLNYPLLWNSKIVPLSIILIFINIIFFIIGYLNGGIDFSETKNSYHRNEFEPTLYFIGLLISILIIILWLVLYFKNNAFKSFYPKNNFSLFKEWTILFVGAFLVGMFAVSYMYAKEVRVRNYFTKEEAKKRCETLSLGSIFIDGSFGTKTYKTVNGAGDTIEVDYNYSEFKNKRYPVISLMNKNIESFQFFDRNNDSLNKLKVRNWMYNNQKTEIKSVMKDYLAIAKEHNLKANINEKEWLELVYNYPDFTEINIVGNTDQSSSFNANNYEDNEEDTAIRNDTIDHFDYVNKYKKEGINGYMVEYYKHYVPADNLNFAYDKIADAWISPDITWFSIVFPIYFALALSILIFSFRVTSGKNWLIAVVAIGIINIIFGIISAIFREEDFYMISIAILTLVLFIYFAYILRRNKGKSISAIPLNGLLWLSGGFIPLIYTLLIDFLKWKYDYYGYSYNGYSYNDYETKAIKIKMINPNQKMFDLIDLLKEGYVIMAIFNILFIFAFMFFISIKIKKWKGIAED